MYATTLPLVVILVGQVSFPESDRYGGEAGVPAVEVPARGDATDAELVPVVEPQQEPDTPSTGLADFDTDGFPGSEPDDETAVVGAEPPVDERPPADSPSGEAPATQPAGGLKPSEMMHAILTAPAGSELRGEPVPLIDVLASGASRLEQAQRVEAYWDLCASVAEYYLGLQEQQDLQRLRSNVTAGQPAGPSPTPWDEAEAELAARISTAQRAAFAAQLRLASWPGGGPGQLPLPADRPHCGDYHSRYEEIFASRPSAEAEQLAALLPLRYAELNDAAAAVGRAEEWLDAVAALRNDTSDGTGAVRALELLALRRRAFVEVARDYNRHIARYCELAAPGEIGAERLLAMLIKSEYTSAGRSTVAPPFGQQSPGRGAAPPSTFTGGEGWVPAGTHRPGEARHDEAVQPASGALQQAPRQERSLVVPRR